MADAAAEEVSSPTTLVMRYLQSKGVISEHELGAKCVLH